MYFRIYCWDADLFLLISHLLQFRSRPYCLHIEWIDKRFQMRITLKWFVACTQCSTETSKFATYLTLYLKTDDTAMLHLTVRQTLWLWLKISLILILLLRIVSTTYNCVKTGDSIREQTVHLRNFSIEVTLLLKLFFSDKWWSIKYYLCLGQTH